MKLIPTQDGSYTLENAAGVSYHSRAGALGESQHVYLAASQLAVRLAAGGGGGPVCLLEVGLGTGLNFALSAQLCTDLAAQHPHASLHYTTYETEPPGPDLLAAFYQPLPPGLHAWAEQVYAQPAGSRGSVHWDVRQRPWPDLAGPHPSPGFDLIYYDAFGPKDAPALWTPEVLGYTLSLLKPGGCLVTFSINGATKRFLKTGGYAYETPRGYGYKREMLVVHG
ncbi:MAG: hypothetical protein LW884_00650 [Bacteroidetes bacterium]|jgi:tRNA U34 5-methylaminomethyl-2-thiouridine-forming methyltransferase MnmC|nr:hypothetical protein [Bacteroidota bacterium]